MTRKILVIDDESSIRRLLKENLTRNGYDVQTASSGRQSLEMARHHPPDLILLDKNLPDINGDEVLEELRKDSRTKLIPIVFVTGEGAMDSLIDGLSIGADDYLAKPFSLRELDARVESVLRRCSVNLDANPLSRLPGNGVIEREIHHMLENNSLFSVLYVDINEFKAYNDFYGFYRGDGVIRKTAELLQQIGSEEGAMVGHIGGDDFIMVTTDKDPAKLCQKILTKFDRMRDSFYDSRDRNAGFILVRDRLGVQRMFPLLSLAIGVVSNRMRPVHSVGEVAAIGAEVKGVAKRMGGSAYFIDKRKSEYGAPQRRSRKDRPLWNVLIDWLTKPFHPRDKNSGPTDPPPHP